MVNLKDRGFLYFVLGQVFSQVGENMSRVSLAWLVFGLVGKTHVGMGAVALSAMVVLQALPPLLFGWLYGHIIDVTESKKRLLFYADALRGLLFCLIPLLYVLHLLTLPVLYLIVFCAAVFSGLFGPAMFAMLPEFPDKNGSLVKRNATINVTGHVGILLGPLIGGILSVLFSPGVVVVVTGLTFLVSAALIWATTGEGIPTPKKILARMISDRQVLLEIKRLVAESSTRSGFRKHVVSNVFYAVTFSPSTKIFCGLSLLVGLAVGPIAVLVPVYVKDVLHSGPTELGALFTCAGAGMFAASLALSKMTHEFGDFYKTEGFLPAQEMLLTVALFVSGLLVVPTGLIHEFLAVAIVTFLSAGLADIFNPVMQTEVQSAVPPGQIGKVLTSIGAFFLIGILAGTIVTPVMVAKLGVVGAFVVIGIARVLAGLLPLFLRTVRDYAPGRASL